MSPTNAEPDLEDDELELMKECFISTPPVQSPAKPTVTQQDEPHECLSADPGEAMVVVKEESVEGVPLMESNEGSEVSYGYVKTPKSEPKAEPEEMGEEFSSGNQDPPGFEELSEDVGGSRSSSVDGAEDSPSSVESLMDMPLYVPGKTPDPPKLVVPVPAKSSSPARELSPPPGLTKVVSPTPLPTLPAPAPPQQPSPPPPRIPSREVTPVSNRSYQDVLRSSPPVHPESPPPSFMTQSSSGSRSFPPLPAAQLMPARPPPPLAASPTSSPPPPMRGKVLTRPAWQTANLAPPPPQVDELDAMEREIDNVKREVAELESIIDSKRKRRDELRQMYADMINQRRNATPVPAAVGGTVRVELQRASPTTPLGLSVGFDESRRCFIVNDVKQDGCVPDWNRGRLAQGLPTVQAGDAIVEVNGQSNGKDEMTREFRSPRIVLIVTKGVQAAEAPRPVGSARPSPRVATVAPTGRIDHNVWPQQSLEAYGEIVDALKNSGHPDSRPKTGIMKFGDVPVRLPDVGGTTYTCQLCGVSVAGERAWIEHFGSASHAASRQPIGGPDLWTRCALEDGMAYWYEHKIGFWSIDEPDRRRTTNHTVLRS